MVGWPLSGIGVASPGWFIVRDLTAKAPMQMITMIRMAAVNSLNGCIPSRFLALPLPRPAGPPDDGCLATISPNIALIIVMVSRHR
jgi:hypothetical protein